MVPRQQDTTKEYIQHDLSASQRQWGICTETNTLMEAMISEYF
jgi:hypothetical protein